MDKVWIILLVAAGLYVYNNNAKVIDSQQQSEEMKKWPKVFVLNDDPNYFVVCFSGVTFNISNLGSNGTSETSHGRMENSSPDLSTNIFTLSDDPSYPVTCRVGQNLKNITDNNQIYPTTNDGGDDSKLTCIRRDYEKNVSAIFLQKTGPIELAWNVFNRSLPYDYMTIKDIKCYCKAKILNDTIVDCGKYGLVSDDKCISAGAAAALCSAG